MGPLAAGQVVLLPFPFSDLSRGKLRPALLLADAGRQDWIACQITSNPYADSQAITLTEDSFAVGGLHRISYVRPAKLFTANETLMLAISGSLTPPVLQAVREAVVSIIRGVAVQT